MNLKKIGLVMGIFGVFLLLIAAIIGIVVGMNSKNQAEVWNKDDPSEKEMKEVEGDEETNALLIDLNMGLGSFGVGLTMIGVGFAIAKDAKGNMAVLGVGLVAALILFLSFTVAIYSGVLSKERAELWNKDDMSEKDEKRKDEIQENEAFLGPANTFCGGFLYGSFGIVLALFTIVLGAFFAKGKKSKKKKHKYAAEPAPASARPPTAEQLYGRDHAPDQYPPAPARKDHYPPPPHARRDKYPPPPY